MQSRHKVRYYFFWVIQIQSLHISCLLRADVEDIDCPSLAWAQIFGSSFPLFILYVGCCLSCSLQPLWWQHKIFAGFYITLTPANQLLSSAKIELRSQDVTQQLSLLTLGICSERQQKNWGWFSKGSTGGWLSMLPCGIHSVLRATTPKVLSGICVFKGWS